MSGDWYYGLRVDAVELLVDADELAEDGGVVGVDQVGKLEAPGDVDLAVLDLVGRVLLLLEPALGGHGVVGQDEVADLTRCKECGVR